MNSRATPRVRHGARPPRHPVARVLAVATAAALGFGLVYPLAVANQAIGAIDVRDNSALIRPLPGLPDLPELPTDGSAGQAVNVLLLGSDVRDGANASIGGFFTGMRNDTTIIMHISADRSRVEMVSIPRDTQVRISECTLNDGTRTRSQTGDFNIAFANGGQQGDPGEAAACVINTVQDLTGIPIDHWVVVDFRGFANMIDALGGVPMCVPERIVSAKARLDLQPGGQIMNGITALNYARLRTAEVGDVSGSDLQRISRQQDLLRQVARTALSKNLLTNIGELTQFLRAGAESLTMNPELADQTYLLGLAYGLRNLDEAGLTFHTAPWAYTEGFLNVELLPEAEQMWDDIRNDRPISVAPTEHASAEWDSGRESAPASPAADPDEASSRASIEEMLAECSA